MTTTTNISKNVAPNNLAQIGIVTKYSLLDYIRSKRFYIMLAITILISVLLTVVVGYYRPESYLNDALSFYSSFFGGTITLVIILSGIFFGGDAISGEFQNKTGYFSVPNPIKRSSIYVGKWLAAFIASSLLLGIFGLITIGNGLFYFSAIPVEFAESFLFAWLYLASVMGLTFFFSSLFKSGTTSIILSVIMFLFVFTLIQTIVATFAGIEPWFILTYGSSIISNIFTVPYPEHIQTFTNPINHQTLTSYTATLPEGLAIMAIYFIVTTIIGLIMFERKEFT
jgi:ABC-2 type transport system permease protein